jgi:hypothetical protein
MEWVSIQYARETSWSEKVNRGDEWLDLAVDGRLILTFNYLKYVKSFHFCIIIIYIYAFFCN